MAPFGVVPSELDDVYPISQNIMTFPYDIETITYVAQQTQNYIAATDYKQVILLREQKVWKGKVLSACKRACKKKQIPMKVLSQKEPWSEKTLEQFVELIEETLTPI
jgi:predicted RNA-binding protein